MLFLTPPSFHQVDAVVIGENAASPAVSGNVIFTGKGRDCLAFDARSLRRLWRKSLTCGVGPLAIVGNDLIVCGLHEWDKADARLFALDPKTGTVRWSMARQGPGSSVVSDTRHFYVSLAPFALTALSRQTHRPVWSTVLVPNRAASLMDDARTLALEKDTLLVGFGETLYAVDARTGRKLWTRPKTYFPNDRIATAKGIVWIEGAGLDVRTGRIRWQNERAFADDVAIVDGDRFVGIGHGRLIWVDVQMGRLLDSIQVGPQNTSSDNQYVVRLGDALVARGIDRAIATSREGDNVRWSVPSREAVDPPVWSQAGAFVSFDGSRLLRYAFGAPSPLPNGTAARQTEAKRLVTRFDLLDNAGRKRLKDLGGDAFAPILHAYLETCAAHDQKRESDASFPLYSRYHDLAEILDVVASPRFTPELLAALDKSPAKGSARPMLMTILAKTAPADVLVPRYLKDLETPTPGFEMYESNTYVARNYVVHSSDPRAVAFLVGKLKDPKADPTLRQDAYWHLAGTGGATGVAAILAERRSRTLLAPLVERMHLANVGKTPKDRKTTTLIATRDDARSGKTYALARSGVLGSRGDLWLLEKGGAGWTNPLFVGVSLDGISHWAKPTGPPPTAFGKTADELAKGAWFETLLAHLPELARDTDGDGLTDREEARLSLDPQKADTDGDGDPDGVDPFPNAATRPLSDAEGVLAAVFEARYHFGTSPGPGVVTMPSNAKPFEMVGWNGPVLWKLGGRDYSTPLEKCYEQGVGFIDFRGNVEKSDWEAKSMTWNADRTEATVLISTYYGGRSGDGCTARVRKFSDDWIVVALDETFVS